MRGGPPHYCHDAENLLKAVVRVNQYQVSIDRPIELYLGMWLNATTDQFESELRELKRLTTSYPEDFRRHVPGLLIGSETVFRRELTSSKLADYVIRVRRHLLQPNGASTDGSSMQRKILISAPEVGGSYYGDAVIDAVDFLTVNFYPYWQAVPAENAARFQLGLIKNMLDRSKGKDVWVGEAGWPTVGPPMGEANASLKSVETFYRDWVCTTNSTNYFWFEAFDEPWKPGSMVERNWGLFYSNRTLKSTEFARGC
ncbi:glycoside hydrolase superfamily [Cladochytrium replicatum]|nr:glycoside hydrolase superfamily [Cladochytrium replicatum]